VTIIKVLFIYLKLATVTMILSINLKEFTCKPFYFMLTNTDAEHTVQLRIFSLF